MILQASILTYMHSRSGLERKMKQDTDRSIIIAPGHTDEVHVSSLQLSLLLSINSCPYNLPTSNCNQIASSISKYARIGMDTQPQHPHTLNPRWWE